MREVRTPRDLAGLDGLIVPGGESTTIGKLLVAYGLEEPIRAAAQDGLPVWGTCAGMILLARDIVGGEPDGRIGLMDLTVQRNAFGRQIDSFEVELPFKGLDDAAPRGLHPRAAGRAGRTRGRGAGHAARRPRRRRPPGQSAGHRLPSRADARHALHALVHRALAARGRGPSTASRSR